MPFFYGLHIASTNKDECHYPRLLCLCVNKVICIGYCTSTFFRIVKMHAKSCYKAFKENGKYSHSYYEKSRFIFTSPLF